MRDVFEISISHTFSIKIYLYLILFTCVSHNNDKQAFFFIK